MAITAQKLKVAQQLSMLPGIRIKDIREAAGLEPLGDSGDYIVLNLPPIPEDSDDES